MKLKSKFLDIKIDTCFKRVFGTERNKQILIDMLNDVVVLDEGAVIQEVTFLKTLQDPDIAYKKQSIVDILCQDQNNNKIIIEMQVAERSGFEKRAQYYAARAYCSQMNEGDKYHELKQVIFLAFTNYKVFPNKNAFKSDHVILDKQTSEHDLKDFSFTFVELPKFTKTINELETNLDRWCYFFKHSGQTREQELEKIIGSQISIGHAYNEVNQFNWTDEQYRTYESDLKNMRDWQAIEDARLQRSQREKAEAVQQSLEKGIEQGIQKGKQLGIEEGRVQERVEIAKQLFATGMNIEQIQHITQLPLGKLQQLQHAHGCTKTNA